MSVMNSAYGVHFSSERFLALRSCSPELLDGHDLAIGKSTPEDASEAAFPDKIGGREMMGGLCEVLVCKQDEVVGASLVGSCWKGDIIWMMRRMQAMLCSMLVGGPAGLWSLLCN